MLHLQGVTKNFGATRAVDDVSLEVAAGEIVAIAGENGAGKTTLMRLIAGELRPDRGRVRVDGAPGFVHQHFMLVNDFTIAENLALVAGGGFRMRRDQAVLREAEETVARAGLALPHLDRRVETLSVGEKARLELVKALAPQPRLLILDEPTAVLTPMESEELFGVIRDIAAARTAVLFISHKLPEVLRIAARIVVMRAGRVVADGPAKSMSVDALAAAMVETRSAARTVRRERLGAAEEVLVCENLVAGQLDHLSLTVGRGEILSIVGVAGNGQADLAAALRGIIHLREGRIAVAGRPLSRTELLRTRAIGHIPEDRTRDGVVAEMSIAENIALSSGTWNRSEAIRRTERLISLYSVRASGAKQRAGDLSGGNQQKVLLARELDRRPEVIIAAEPTRGLDIEASRFVHEQLLAAAAAGAAILLITSDLDEAFLLGDAVQTIYRGRLSERLSPAEAPSRVANLMAGLP